MSFAYRKKEVFIEWIKK